MMDVPHIFCRMQIPIALDLPVFLHGAGRMSSPAVLSLLRVSTIYIVAVFFGWLFSLLHVPLPWMIGPLLFTAALSIYGVDTAVPWITRHMGQVVVAGSVGLAFTPAILIVLVEQAVPMVLAAITTLIAGFLTAAIMRRMMEVDPITASLSCVPLGPMEAAHLAEQYGVPPAPVAFVQTLRIALTVTLIPPILVWLDPSHPDLTRALSGANWQLGAVLTLLSSTVGVFVFRLLRVSNPTFLGALSGSGVAMLAGLPVSAVPYVMIAGGQVLLGVWLGAGFKRDLLEKARTFIPAASVATILLLASCASVATVLSWWTGLRWDAMVLATAPGSVTEMALTAKILNADPALVTSFHVVRIFMLIPFAPVIFAVVRRLAGHGRVAPPPPP